MRRKGVILTNVGTIIGVAIALSVVAWLAFAWSIAPKHPSFEQMLNVAVDRTKDLAAIIQSLAVMLLALTVVYLLSRAWMRHKRPQLIIEKLVACGATSTPPATHISAEQLDEMSLRLRELLVEAEKRIGYALRHRRKGHGGSEAYQYGGPDKYLVSKDLAAPLSSTQDTGRMIEISLPGSSGEQTQWATQMLNVLFPPHLICVRGTVHCDPKAHAPSAISFEIVETGSGGNRAETFRVKASPNAPVTQCSDIPEILVEFASRVLAIELLREGLLILVPWWPWKRERFRAEVDQLAGMLYTTYFKDAPFKDVPDGDDDLYRRGCQSFNQAIGHDRTWYKPYAALADLHSLEGQRKLLWHQNTERGIALQYQAISEYDYALELLRRITDRWWYHKRAAFANRKYEWGEQKLQDPIRRWYKLRAAAMQLADRFVFNTASSLEYAHHRLLIKVGKARAQLLTEDPNEAIKAAEDIWAIENHGPHPHHKRGCPISMITRSFTT